jgi:hypothetical protein
VFLDVHFLSQKTKKANKMNNDKRLKKVRYTYRFDLVREGKLKKIIAQTGESYTTFFDRMIDNECAKLEHKYENVLSSDQQIIERKIDRVASTYDRIEIELMNINDKLKKSEKNLTQQIQFSSGISMMVQKVVYKIFYYFIIFFRDKFNVTNEEMEKRGDVVNKRAREAFGSKTEQIRSKLFKESQKLSADFNATMVYILNEE